ncbi:MAG TPA: 50S ribosomal protein L1 [Candidatus Poseidoniales archaeon]|jgi:large subunit ribosomal protein L1|nr:MAG: 50S ribosomal protein L1 [Euryarchaeota archaeon]HIG02834.1 50S ribosomal protein L1 [Candidatus Poseidoniales archaeon]HIK77877.1 50S ribosomal protein L1 [Candidatus Poseidoniales archaeon]
MEQNISDAIKAALEAAPERKFVESVDFAITIKDVDLKNPANRVQEEIRLPSGRGRDIQIAMFAGTEAAVKAKEAGIFVIAPEEIEELGKNKMTAKKLANRYDFFLAEVSQMALIGRYLGVVLGPRGKMPRPCPPNVDPGMIAAGLKSTVVVRSRDRITFHTAIGTRSQSHEELLANAIAVWDRVTRKLERGAGNIRSFYIKTTMGPSHKVEVVL